ncbi:MAG: chain length determinant protein EpsF [Burkholderiales bacterium]|nr:chain length determinant protein EpsF [Burkholderiales bacterium]MDE2433730.1 chain length determinant protein EpsF [Burkholderiales bacterium]
MTFQLLFAIVRARWLVASSVFALIFASVAAFTWLMPKNYTANASIILDIKGQDPIAGYVSPALASPTYLMTQVDVVTSNRVALKVVHRLRLNESTEMRQKWLQATKGVGSFESWLANLIKANLEAHPSRGSNVIYLSYQATDPNFAAAVANGFVQAYLDTTLELRTAPAKQYNDFFDENARSLRSALEKAQARLSAYQQQQGLLVNDERFDVETARLNELSSQYVLTQAAVADSGSRQAAAAAQGDKSPDVLNNPIIAGLKTDLNRQEAALEQLATRLGDRHPAVVEAKSGIDELKRKLELEVRRVSSSVGVGNSVNVSRAAQIKLALDEQRAKVLKMKAVRDEAEMLQRDVDNAQRAYEGVVARMNSTSLESQANQANISALEMATPPSVPSSPRVLSNLALGILVGSVLAVCMALLIERFDPRLRAPSDVEHLFQLPQIGVIPAFQQRTFSGRWLDRLALKRPTVKALSHKVA